MKAKRLDSAYAHAYSQARLGHALPHAHAQKTHRRRARIHCGKKIWQGKNKARRTAPHRIAQKQHKQMVVAGQVWVGVAVALLFVLVWIFYFLWSPVTLRDFGIPGPILALDEDSGFQRGINNVTYLLRLLVERIIQFLISLVLLVYNVIASLVLFVINNWRLILTLALLAFFFRVYQSEDSNIKTFIDNTYSGKIYPVVDRLVQPAADILRPYASLALLVWDTYLYANKILFYQTVGILWDATYAGTISWTTTVNSIAATLRSLAFEIVRILANGLFFSDLNLADTLHNAFILVNSLTDKTEVLCHDANFIIELIVRPLLDPSLETGLVRLTNGTWVILVIPERWLLTTLADPANAKPPDFNDAFDQLALGFNDIGLHLDYTFSYTINRIVDIFLPSTNTFTLVLPPTGVAIGKIAVVFVRVAQTVLQVLVNAPYWFGVPGNFNDPINGYILVQFLGITPIPPGYPRDSYINIILDSIDDAAVSLGEFFSYFYLYFGYVVEHAIKVATAIVKIVFVILGQISLAARGINNFAQFLSTYDYYPVRSELADLGAALADLLAPYYEPIGYFIFSGLYSVFSGAWWIYSIIVNLALLETPQGVAYFKGTATTTPGFQVDLNVFLTDLDTFAGDFGGIISGLQRFGNAGADNYNVRRAASASSKCGSRGDTFAKYWSKGDVPLWNDAAQHAVRKSNDPLEGFHSVDARAPNCANLTVYCTQACNDWCTSDHDACQPDPYPQTFNRSGCFFGVRDAVTGNTIHPGCIDVCTATCSYEDSFCSTDWCNLAYVGTCVGNSRSVAVYTPVPTNATSPGQCSLSPSLAENRCIGGNALCCLGGLFASLLRIPIRVVLWLELLGYAAGTQTPSQIPSSSIFLDPLKDALGYAVCILSRLYVTVVYPTQAYYVPKGLCWVSSIVCVLVDLFDIVLGILANSRNFIGVDANGLAVGYFPEVIVKIQLPNLYADISFAFTCAIDTNNVGYDPIGSILTGLSSTTISALSLFFNVIQFIVSVGVEAYVAATFPSSGTTGAERFFSFLQSLSTGQNTNLFDIKASLEDLAAGIASIFLFFEPLALFIFEAEQTLIAILWVFVQSFANLPGVFGGAQFNNYFPNPNGFLVDINDVFDKASGTAQAVGGMISGIDNLIVGLGGTVEFKKRSESEKGSANPLHIELGNYDLGSTVRRTWKPSHYEKAVQPGWIKDPQSLAFARTTTSSAGNYSTHSSARYKTFSEGSSHKLGERADTFPRVTFDNSVCALVCNAVCYTTYNTNSTYGYLDADPGNCFVLARVVSTPGDNRFELYGGCYYTCNDFCTAPCSACTTVACEEMCALSCTTVPDVLPGNLLAQECTDAQYNAAQVQCTSKFLCCIGGMLGSFLRTIVGIVRYVVMAVLAPILPDGYQIPSAAWFLDPITDTVSYLECSVSRIYQIVLLLVTDANSLQNNALYIPPLLCVLPSARCVVVDALLLIEDIFVHARDVFTNQAAGYFKTAVMGYSATNPYVVANTTSTYQNLLASTDGLADCIGSPFLRIYYPLDALISSVLRLVMKPVRIIVRLAVELIEPTPGVTFQRFLGGYDYDGLQAAADTAWSALGQIAEDVFEPFRVVVQYFGATIDSFVSCAFGALINIDILPGTNGYYVTEMLGTGNPDYDPGTIPRVESNLRNFFYGVRLILNRVWAPFATWIFDATGFVTHVLGALFRTLFQFLLNTTAFPAYLESTDFDQAFLYYDAFAVSTGDLFAPIHSCIPIIVTSVMRVFASFFTVVLNIVTNLPVLFSGGSFDSFITEVRSNATDATVKLQNVGSSIAALVLYIGKINPTTCSAPVIYNGGGGPGSTNYTLPTFTPVTPLPTTTPPVSSYASNNTDPLCGPCCESCCVEQVLSDNFTTTLWPTHAAEQNYINTQLQKLCKTEATSFCSPDCGCLCPNPCAGVKLSVTSSVNSIVLNGVTINFGGYGFNVPRNTLRLSFYDFCSIGSSPYPSGQVNCQIYSTSNAAGISVTNPITDTVYAQFPPTYACNNLDSITVTADLGIALRNSSNGNQNVATRIITQTFTYTHVPGKKRSTWFNEVEAAEERSIAEEQQHQRTRQMPNIDYDNHNKEESRGWKIDRNGFKVYDDAHHAHAGQTFRNNLGALLPDVFDQARFARNAFARQLRFNQTGDNLDATYLRHMHDARYLRAVPEVARGKDPRTAASEQHVRIAPRAVNYFYCSKNDLYGCSTCQQAPVPVTFNGYANLTACKADCEGQAFSYPRCNGTNQQSSALFNLPPLITGTTCGSKTPGLTLLPCCVALLINGVSSGSASILRYAIGAIAVVVDPNGQQIPTLDDIIKSYEIVLQGVSCLASFPFVTKAMVQEATSELIYRILEITTIPLNFANTAIKIVRGIANGLNAADITTLLKTIIDPIYNAIIAMIAWLEAVSFITGTLANTLREIIGLLYKFFTFLSQGVITILTDVINVFVSLFGAFSGNVSGTAFGNSVIKLISDIGSTIIKPILEAFGRVLFGSALWDKLEAAAASIVSFFEKFQNCFKSAKKFIKCITGKKRDVPSSDSKPTLTCVTCAKNDIVSILRGEIFTDDDDQDDKTKRTSSVLDGFVLRARDHAAATTGAKRSRDASEEQTSAIKRRALAVRPSMFFPSSAQVNANYRRASSLTSSNATVSGGSGIDSPVPNVATTSFSHSPYGAVFPGDIPADYGFFTDGSFDADSDTFEAVVAAHWPKGDSTSGTSRCDLLVQDAAEDGKALSKIDYNDYMRCVMLFIATRMNNIETTQRNQALYESLYRATDSQAAGDDMLVQDEFGDYQVNGQGDVLEADFETTLPDMFMTDDTISTVFLTGHSPASSGSPAHALLTVLTNPDFHYYQYNEYVPPAERIAQDDDSRKRHAPEKAVLGTHKGLTEFYVARRTKSGVVQDSVASRARSPAVGQKRQIDPDYDPRYDYEAMDHAKRDEMDYQYEYAPRGMIPFADLVSGVLDANGITHPYTVNYVVRTAKQLSPKYYAKLLDIRTSNGQDTTFMDVFDKVQTLFSNVFHSWRNTSFEISQQWARYDSMGRVGGLADDIRTEGMDTASQRHLSPASVLRVHLPEEYLVVPVSPRYATRSNKASKSASSYHSNKYTERLRSGVTYHDPSLARGDSISLRMPAPNAPVATQVTKSTAASSSNGTTAWDYSYESGLVFDAQRKAFYNHRAKNSVQLRPWIMDIISGKALHPAEAARVKAFNAASFYDVDSSTLAARMFDKGKGRVSCSNADKVPRSPVATQMAALQSIQIDESNSTRNNQRKVFGRMKNRLVHVTYPLANAYHWILEGERMVPVFPLQHEMNVSRKMFRADVPPIYSPGVCQIQDEFFEEICVQCALLGSSLEAYVSMYIGVLNRTSIIFGGPPLPALFIYSRPDIDAGYPAEVDANIRYTEYKIVIPRGPTQPYLDPPPRTDRFDFNAWLVAIGRAIVEFFFGSATFLDEVGSDIRTFFTDPDPTHKGTLAFYIDFIFICDPSAVSCQARNGTGIGLGKALVVLIAVIFFVSLILSFVYPGGLVYFAGFMVVFFIPLLWALAYFQSPGCTFTGYVPYCVADDATAIINRIPAEIPWPDYLKIYYRVDANGTVEYVPKPPGYTGNNTDGVYYRFLSCSRDRDFVDGLDELAFFLKWRLPGVVDVIKRVERTYIDPILGTNMTLGKKFDQFDTTGGAKPEDIYCFYESLPSLAVVILVLALSVYISYLVVTNIVVCFYLLVLIVSTMAEIVNEWIATLSGVYMPYVIVGYDTPVLDEEDYGASTDPTGAVRPMYGTSARQHGRPNARDRIVTMRPAMGARRWLGMGAETLEEQLHAFRQTSYLGGIFDRRASRPIMNVHNQRNVPDPSRNQHRDQDDPPRPMATDQAPIHHYAQTHQGDVRKRNRETVGLFNSN